MTFDPGGASPVDSGVFGLPKSIDARVVLVPVPFEATTSYGRGTARGPAAILQASKQVDLFDLDTGRPYEHGIVMLDEAPDVHAWNEEACRHAGMVIDVAGAIEGHAELEAALARTNELGEKLDAWVHDTVRTHLERGKIVGVVGGDHSVPFGAIRAHAERWPGLGVLHFDAHADLREAYEGFTRSHASIMHNVTREVPGVGKLVQVGIRDFSEAEHDRIAGSGGRIVTFFDATMQRDLSRGERFAAIASRIAEALPLHVYVSFDIDGLDPSLCPHTGTPVPSGLSFAQAVQVLEAVVRSGRRIVGFDLVEVAPGDDDDWDANVGARLLYKIIGWLLLSQRDTPPT